MAIVNEILGLIAKKITIIIKEEIITAQYYSISLDETSDISLTEQVLICIRIVLPSLSVNDYSWNFSIRTVHKPRLFLRSS